MVTFHWQIVRAKERVDLEFENLQQEAVKESEKSNTWENKLSSLTYIMMSSFVFVTHF